MIAAKVMHSLDPASGHFAVAPHEEGLAVFRAAREGLRYETSSDGLRWVAETAVAEERGPLWPICAAEKILNTHLFCTDAGGQVVGVTADRQRLSIQAPFRPVASGERWYEEMPDPSQMAIVRDDRNGVYRAFFCARRKTGRHPERRGCIGVATSPDLRTWNIEPPLFAPNLFPDLFAPHVLGDEGRCFIFYATREEGGVHGLRFAVAPRLEGPYERMEPDLLGCDVRSAVHTVRLGPRRLVFFTRTVSGGDSPTTLSRPGQLDFHANGRPFVRFYEPLLGLLGRTLFQTEATLASGEILARVLPRYGADFRLDATARSHGARAVGVLFRTTMTGHDNVTLWLDYAAGAVILRRGVSGRLLARSPRKLIAGEKYRITVWAEGPFADVYVDDEWVLTGETEGRKAGWFGLAILGGDARFENVAAQAIQNP